MDELLKKKDNESNFEWKIRLCNAKLNKEIDLDWSEIAQLLKLDVSSDHLRKLSYAYKEFSQYINEKKEQELINKSNNKIENNVEEDDFIKQLEEKTLALEKARKKLQSTKIEYNRNIRVDSRTELLYENIKDAKQRLPLPEFREIPYKENGGEYILAWADLHYGADFISENNIYSREECKNRFELLVSKIKNMCIEKSINRLNVCGLGDDIQGLLRITDVKINDISVVECVVEISRLIANVLNEISKVTNVVYYHTMASNHTQTRPLTGKSDLIKEDMEFIIGHYIEDLLSNNPRVEVVLSDKDYHSFELAGQNILTLHGHQIKGVKNAIKDYSMLHRKFYDICLIGHLHGGNQISVGESLNGNTEIVIVPSFIGSDPYADSLKVGSKAMAKLYKLEKNCGITENYTIVLN